MFAQSLTLLLGTVHEVVVATSGSEALERISEQRPSAVLLDHKLPDIDGLTVLKVIQALPNPPPVVMLSGEDCSQLINSAKKLGASGFLHKSLPAEELLRAIDMLGKGSQYWTYDQSSTSADDISNASESRCLNTLVVNRLGITTRQLDVLELLVQGHSNKVIANQLGIADSTVKTHIKMIFQTLKVNNRVACLNKAIELGLLDEQRGTYYRTVASEY